METSRRRQFSIDIDGCRIVCEHYGHIENPEEILLFCHGFPGSSRLVRLSEWVKAIPVSIVEINYRGDRKSEGKFSFTGSVTDIRTVAGYLKEHYKIPVHALGYSMGGCYVSNIVNSDPHLFDKVFLVNPVTDTVSLFSNKVLTSELWKQAEAILSLQTPEAYEKELNLVTGVLNPMKFAHKIESNITIVQSTADEVLEPDLAERFYSLLKCKKSFHKVPDGKHDLMGDEKELKVLFEKWHGSELVHFNA